MEEAATVAADWASTGWRANVMTGGQQSFPAWLEITAFSDALRLCPGHHGTIACRRKRHDSSAQALIPPLAQP